METSKVNDRTARGKILHFVLRALLVVWAGFWAWFVIAASLGEPPPPPWWIPTAWLGSLAALVALCWRWPAIGGTALVVAGAWAGYVFANPWARALLAVPAIVLGLAFLAEILIRRLPAPSVRTR